MKIASQYVGLERNYDKEKILNPQHLRDGCQKKKP
jgi:hypothetical protein